MTPFSTIASVHVGNGGELAEAVCRRLWIKNHDERFAETASKIREARDGQTWASRISARGRREVAPCFPRAGG